MSTQTINEDANGPQDPEAPRNGSWWWWQPDQNSPEVEALKLTRLDGLKEALKPNIHVSKR